MSVSVVLIGYGYLGKYHLDKILQINCAELTAIIEPFPAAKEHAEQYLLRQDLSHIPVLSDLSKLEPSSYDAVIIVTPTSTHYQLVLQCLKLRKHVFCEKPLTPILHDTLHLTELASKLDIVTQVGHSERFHSIFNRKNKPNIWDIAGDILESTNCTVKFTRLAPYKGRGIDVDVSTDLMIHDIDIACLLFDMNNYQLRRVHGVQLLEKKRDNTVRDHVHAYFNLKPDLDKLPLEIEFEAGRGYHTETREITLWSTAGVVTIDLLHCKIIMVTNGQVVTTTYHKSDHLLNEQIQFYDCILNQKQPDITIPIAYEVLRHLDKIESVLRAQPQR